MFIRILLVIESILLVVAFLAPVMAWNNGDATGDFDVYATDALVNWWKDSKHYGTHDWIAEAALEAVLNDDDARAKWVDNEESLFWTDRRKMIYLIGTEAPDLSSLKLKLNNYIVRGVGDRRRHKIYFYDFNEGSSFSMQPHRNTNIAHDIRRYTEFAKDSLKEGRCDLAAYYIGFLMHYIGDFTCFFHTLKYDDNIEVLKDGVSRSAYWDLHGRFETIVQKATSTSGSARDDYFDYDVEFDVGTLDLGLDYSWHLCKLLAYSTRFNTTISDIDEAGSSVPGEWEAVNCYCHFRDFKKTLPSGHRTTVNHFDKQFFEYINDRLQAGIFYGANLINHIAEAWSELGEIGISKYCEDCSGQGNTSHATLNCLRSLSVLVSLILFLGLASIDVLPILVAAIATGARKSIPLPIPYNIA